MRQISRSSQFKRSFAKKGELTSEFIEILYLLIQDKPLPEKYRDHALKGEFNKFRECHIKPDLLLLYRKIDNNTLELADIGSHADFF